MSHRFDFPGSCIATNGLIVCLLSTSAFAGHPDQVPAGNRQRVALSSLISPELLATDNVQDKEGAMSISILSETDLGLYVDLHQRAVGPLTRAAPRLEFEETHRAQ
ncbi:MAG: hypothetical protein U1F52_02275 [Burkholderiales bacterium]